MRVKLSDLTIQNFKYQHPQVTFWDALLPAFGVRVGSRSKTFIVMHGHARKRETLRDLALPFVSDEPTDDLDNDAATTTAASFTPLAPLSATSIAPLPRLDRNNFIHARRATLNPTELHRCNDPGSAG
jgi:hypothetical protein